MLELCAQNCCYICMRCVARACPHYSESSNNTGVAGAPEPSAASKLTSGMASARLPPKGVASPARNRTSPYSATSIPAFSTHTGSPVTSANVRRERPKGLSSALPFPSGSPRARMHMRALKASRSRDCTPQRCTKSANVPLRPSGPSCPPLGFLGSDTLRFQDDGACDYEDFIDHRSILGSEELSNPHYSSSRRFGSSSCVEQPPGGIQLKRTHDDRAASVGTLRTAVTPPRQVKSSGLRANCGSGGRGPYRACRVAGHGSPAQGTPLQVRAASLLHLRHRL